MRGGMIMDNNINPSSQQLFSAPQNDIIQWNRKKYKSKVSEKEKYNDDYVTKHISKLRKATYRKDGRYQVVVNKNGKKKTIYGKSPYKANCMADIYEAEDNVELHKILTIPKYRFLFCYSFFRWRNYMLFYSCLEKSTVERYENTYKKYIAGKSIDNTDVRKLDTKHLTQFFFSVLDEKESISTKDYQAIRHIIKGCIDFVYDQELDEEEDEEPSLDWDKVKRKIPKGKIYSKKRVERTVSKSSKNELNNNLASKEYDDNYACKIMLLINFSLGLRIGELAALEVTDVDMIERVVYIHNNYKTECLRDEYGNRTGVRKHYLSHTKTPKGERIIPISDSAYELFKQLFEYRKMKGISSKFLACDGDKCRDRTKKLNRVLNEWCDEAGVMKFNPHKIRKTFASILSKSPDIDIATISTWLGHAQVSTTLNNYIVPEDESVAEQIKKMSSYV